MKVFITLFLLFASPNLILAQAEAACGDKVYAGKEQTEYDDRFDEYTKIAGQPEYKEGKKELENFIRSQLKTTQDAKNMVFNINYVVVVGCDGSVKEVKLLGNPQFAPYTNIADILKTTGGKWEPAKKSGAPVNCVYFGKLLVVGAMY